MPQQIGHSVSYCEVNCFEIFTAENESKNACLQNYVPNNVHPSSFVTFVCDNCDHDPETINGEVMHCTNGIIIQRTPKQEIISQYVAQNPCKNNDCNWTQTQNHLVRKQTLNHLAKLAK